MAAHSAPTLQPGTRGPALRWPLPALLVWLLAWALGVGLPRLGMAPAAALAVATAAAGLAAVLPRGLSRWRRVYIAAGFPLSALLLAVSQALPPALSAGGLTGLPAWAWLLPLGVLLAAYPLRAWRDAPLFPTPTAALAGLAAQLQLPPAARVLDAGCGLGHGLQALHAELPGARIEGIEWSPVLAWGARLRCRFARVRRGDMWAVPWSGHQLVYLFQRPETMARAWAKAQAELAPGAWLASLDFAVPDRAPTAVLRQPGQPPVWLYRVGGGSIRPVRRR